LTKSVYYFTLKLNSEKEGTLLQLIEDISPTKKRLTIEVPAEIIEQETKNSFERLRQKASIPGFRPGKTPLSLLEKRFGKEVQAEVLEKIVPEYYGMALREADLQPLTPPELEGAPEVKKNTPFLFTFTVEVLPKIENLQYDNLTALDITVTVEEADIDEALKKIAEEKATFEAAEKEIETDDMVSFDYLDCEVIGSPTSSDVKEQVEKLGNEIFPPDIFEKTIGKKKGDVIEFTKTFDSSMDTKELADKTLNIKVTVSEVKRKILPSIDEDFAKDVGLQSMSELRERLKENILRLKKEQVAKLQKGQLLNKLIESHTIEVPETLLQRELESVVMHETLSQEENQKKTPGTDSAAPEQADVESKNIQEEMKQKALKNVRASLIVGAIGQKEGITVSDEEANERILLLAKRISANPEAVKSYYTAKDGSLGSLKQSIFEDKVMDLLLSRAVLEKGATE
jgi:trigger factor